MAGWTSKASSGYIQADVSMCARANGDIFIAGSGTKEMKKYDPLTNTWTACASLPANVERRGINIIAVTGDLIFLTGGAFNPTYPVGTYTYDPATNTYTARTNCPANIHRAAIATDGTAVYLIAGNTGAVGHVGVHKWTIATDVWTIPHASLNPGNSATYWMGGNGGMYYGGKVFLWSGYYDIASNTYTAYSTMPTSSETTMLPGSPYGTLAPYCSENLGIAGSNRNQINYFRDLAVAPYTLSLGNSGVVKRTTDPLASTYTDRSKYNAGRYFYLHGGIKDTSPYNDTDAFHRYDHEFTNVITVTTPSDGSTINSDVPTVSTTVPDNGEDVVVRMQMARDTAFTSNLKDFYLDFPGAGPTWVRSGVLSYKMSSTTIEELFTGTWYMRTRVENGAVSGAWSTTRTFTVSHPPAAALTFPINGQGIVFGSGSVTFQWNFSDTSETDNQTAYQLVLERNDTGAVILDTGKIVSGTPQHAYTVSVTYKNLILRWKVRLWDSDDVVGSYSPYSTFSLADAPVATLTSPLEGGTVDSGAPTITWTFTAPGRTQYSYRVRIYNSLSELAYDSGVVISSATTHTPPNAVIGVGAASVVLNTWDSTNLQADDDNAFTAIFDEPLQPQFFVDDTVYDSTGYVRITWTSANRDATFIEYRVYRREVGDTMWDLIYTDNDNSASDYTFDDYSAGSGKSYEYSVIQLAQRAATPVESQKTAIIQADPQSTQYWLIDNDNPDRNILISNVTSDSFTDEYEQATLKVIGRGNHVDYGTRWGYVGSLSAQLRGTEARLQRLQLEYLKSLRVEMYLRNPFGDVWRVATGNIQVDRVSGVGTTEMSDVTIPYEEVS